MSGKPNSEGVKLLHQALRDCVWNREQLAESRKAFNKARDAVTRYENGLTSSRENVKKLLMDMDVYSVGNSGYEDRRFELLLMLSKEF